MQPIAALAVSNYSKHCAECHGEKGGGDGPVALAIRPKLQDFRAADYMREQTLSWFYRAISRGVAGSAMLRWDNVLNEQERWDMAAYVWSLATAPETLERGRAVYRAQCLKCHAANGAGVAEARLDDPMRATLSRAEAESELRAVHADLVTDLGAADILSAAEYVWTFLYVPAE